ncbi:hypothetical protein [Luteipulveratus mongoliensis]|uniref:Uncharacterized protein n=1 Tax=Luteipulveratus mongoliensis TaxID=571913 RepID=A0A0K1JGD9_9MICO|nr:hypothetical protein [Luteipulveratus mongoliensis]AKU15777.1 hypothetical protein VV02_07780 [Luteipulveratus mongoliensis]
MSIGQTTDENKAEAASYRDAASLLDRQGGKYEAAARRLRTLAEVADPRPTHPDGTLAFVTAVSGNRYVGEMSGGQWTDGETTLVSNEHVVRVEIIATVPEGHKTYDPAYYVPVRRDALKGYDAARWREFLKTADLPYGVWRLARFYADGHDIADAES